MAMLIIKYVKDEGIDLIRPSTLGNAKWNTRFHSKAKTKSLSQVKTRRSLLWNRKGNFILFVSCEPVITRLNGHQLTADYLAKVGFNKPILITNRDGLDLALPSRTISLAEIHELVGRNDIQSMIESNECLGPDRSIDIIDCEKQVTYKMGLDEYIEYFESIERNKVYNVLSLEISNTKYVERCWSLKCLLSA